jgi:zona occludens toxin
MIIFSEGVPRSGKSYDAVKNHIVVAIKKGRACYARLNGLDHEKIANYCQISIERCRELLHLVPTSEVKSTFLAEPPDGSGEWTIPTRFIGALVVIDEVHEFYVGGGKDQLHPGVEQFFALHGQYDMDLVLLTQFYKRLHVAIRSRIERKCTFQKLTVLGNASKFSFFGKREPMYRVTYWQSLAPDRYQKVGGETKRYDPAIFPLYRSYVADNVDATAYDAGAISVWKPMIFRAVIVLPIGVYAIYFLLNFFAFGGASELVSKQPSTTLYVSPFDASSLPPVDRPPVSSPSVQPLPPSVVSALSPPPPSGVSQQSALPVVVVDPYEGLSEEQRYVWHLAENARIRFAGAIYGLNRTIGVVEWYGSDGEVFERMTTHQLEALGVKVIITAYGVRMVADTRVLVATSWPLVQRVRDPVPQLYNTGGDVVDSRTPSHSVSDSSTPVVAYAASAAYGDISVAPTGTNSIGR